MTINEWLKNPNYQTGIALYKQLKGMDNYYNYFFQVSNPPADSPYFKMLIQRLQRLQRISVQQPQSEKKEKSLKEIKVKKITIDESDGSEAAQLQQNKLYINKILALKWNDLDKRDKEVFFNNQRYFEMKKELFIQNSENMKKIKSLHIGLKQSDTKEKKAEILEEAKEIEKIITINWQIIDKWEQPEAIEMDKVEKAKTDAVKKERRKDQLKGYIRRAKNELKNPKNKYSERVKNSKEARLKMWEDELEQLEK